MLSGTENVLGFLALLAYVATLLPSNLKIVFPALKMSWPVKKLLRHRRSIGIWTFNLSMAHAAFVIGLHNMDVFERSFYYKSASGLMIMGIFALLTITSNNWSIKKLRRNWKRLHGLTYLAAALLPWHIAAKMEGQWTLLTGIAIPLTALAVALLCCRKYLEMTPKT